MSVVCNKTSFWYSQKIYLLSTKSKRGSLLIKEADMVWCEFLYTWHPVHILTLPLRRQCNQVICIPTKLRCIFRVCLFSDLYLGVQNKAGICFKRINSCFTAYNLSINFNFFFSIIRIRNNLPMQ